MIVNIIMVSEIMFGELHDGNNGSKNPHWRRRRKKSSCKAKQKGAKSNLDKRCQVKLGQGWHS